MALTDEQILELNNGKIVPGDYVVVTGTPTAITYNTYDVGVVNIVLEKTSPDGNVEDVSGYLNSTPILCQNDVQPKTFIWLSNINPDINQEYPIYRIKVVSSQPQGVIAYSNYFKISVNNEDIKQINNTAQ